ncbi:hypothetical protein BDW62DRAFT_196871 [Aspergillus aurantiobrunneus]
MEPSNTSNGVSKSGITTDASTGERYIPSSIRADGSKRKEIKVRPGYRPPEDVELYKNRAAAAWKNRGKSGVPGAEGLTENEPPKEGSAASNKNAKRREAKKKAKAAQDGATAPSGKDISQIANWRATPSGGDKKQPEGPESSTAPVDPEVEQEKKARNLKKKLKQARDLNDKKDKGEALLPEQLEKVIKIQELVRQLDALGFDSNGEKKESQEAKPEK